LLLEKYDSLFSLFPAFFPIGHFRFSRFPRFFAVQIRRKPYAMAACDYQDKTVVGLLVGWSVCLTTTSLDTQSLQSVSETNSDFTN